MTGYQSKKAAAQFKVEGPLHVVCQCDKCKAQPAQEPVAWAVYDKRGGSKSLHWPEQHSPDGDTNMFDAVPLYTTPPQKQNFCPRCGKRTKDIHTCTPPQKNT